MVIVDWRPAQEIKDQESTINKQSLLKDQRSVNG
jgi:hypothetical protein